MAPGEPPDATGRPADLCDHALVRSGSPVRVFISYAWDDDAHVDLVRQFWDFLRGQGGIDARLDMPAAGQPRDWLAWMQEQVEEADFVLVVASPEYKRRAAGRTAAGAGRGVQWEARLIREISYADNQAGLAKVLPVVLPGRSAAEIPLWLGPTTRTHYVVTHFTVAGADALLRYLTGQPYEVDPPLSPAPVLLPRQAGSGPGADLPDSGRRPPPVRAAEESGPPRPSRADPAPRPGRLRWRHAARSGRRPALAVAVATLAVATLAVAALAGVFFHGRHQRAGSAGGQQTFPGYRTVYADRQVRLPGPPYCMRTLVDLDIPRVAAEIPPTAGTGRDIDLSYDGCGPVLTRSGTGSRAAGFTAAGTTTPARCSQDAASRALAPNEPVASFPAGAAACVITSTGAIAWLRVQAVGAPYAPPPEDPPHPTLTLLVTLWRPQ
jgi:hypothetical protein